jgi:hypothetical protein
VLGAGVVRQLIAAARVNREDVEHLMTRTKQHREQKEP